MAPTPLEPLQVDPKKTSGRDKHSVVISGMSGLFPKARNIKELSNILYNKVNPIDSENIRWNFKHPEATKYVGMVSDLDLFDAQFFTVYHTLANYVDPMSRKILEHTYQAVYDAGLSPAHLYGKKVAVFVGSSLTNTEHRGVVDFLSKTGLGIVGCSKTMFANRVSYWLNVKGPSVSVDEGDSSSIIALEQAFSTLSRGDCEAAIIAGASLNLLPHASIYHRRMAAVCSDGKTKSFDKNSDGYALSDGIGVLFLQRAEDALRIYAELKYVKSTFVSLIKNDTGPQYGYLRNSKTVAKFIKEFYEEAQVSPNVVRYVEAYGTGVPDVDKSELEAIAEAYCEDRSEPLLVGSITSNIGLTEAASGIAAVTKVLLGYYTGKLAANLHCREPRQDVLALRDGRMRIVTEHQRMAPSYTAINGMSYGGVNTHVLLQAHFKPKDLSQYETAIPRLVTISGRQESAVNIIFNDLKSKPIDAEELALFHNIHTKSISGHLGRGYIILDKDENQKTVRLGERVEYFNNASRPLWFVYSGMGSQWPTMGAQLMRIPIFGAAIERCHRVLNPRGLDLVNIITSPDKTIFDNILHSFVGIAAIQIGLTDILFELGLKPDGIIGHSVGELACAYADGCLTAEEMILAAYSRGRVSLETPLIRGSMAAIGLGYDKISDMCPPEIDVACHNGPDSSTISGPADVMREFVAQLTAKGIFAKEVPCSNIAYHSRYIADAGSRLEAYLKNIIKHPKLRSQRWMSTSVPQEHWNSTAAQYCSAEYHTNNLLNPVLFEETSKLIPNNAVLVEIAPHGLLQAILKRSLSPDCQHVPLTRRGHIDNALFLLQAIGNLYVEGFNPRVQVLYPKVQFPVSTPTPMLSHLPKWVHDEKWKVVNYCEETKKMAAACRLLVSIHDEELSYLRGSVVRGKIRFPFSAALVSVWDMFALSMEKPKKSISVQFSDVHCYAQPVLHNQRLMNLNIDLHRGTGRFEVTSEHSRIASGYITHVVETPYRNVNPESEDMVLSSADVYQLLSDKGYIYNDDCRTIECASLSLNEAALVWRDNWNTFIDGMVQLNLLRQAHDTVPQLTNIRNIFIDVRKHYRYPTYIHNNKTVMAAYVDSLLGFTRCGGVLIENILFQNKPPITQDHLVELVGPLQCVASISPKEESTSGVTLQSSTFGQLDSLHWVIAPKRDSSDDITVTVHYAGINMTDVKKARGLMSCDINSYGMDYSGTTKSGERVMGIVCSGAASTQVHAQTNQLWPVPTHWSLEDAATVPVAYIQAFYCLVIKGKLQRGMNVLVHGGAGALGQAAIAIALSYNCQIFTTVKDIHKKRFLQKLYPELGDNILCSRDSSFADYVVLKTQGKCCHIVISCVKGGLKNVSFKCSGSLGILIDIVQIENRENYALGMDILCKERAYTTVDLSAILTDTKYTEALHGMVSDGIALGYVRPLSRVTYAPHEAARAFRLLARSEHRGRVLLRMQDNIGHSKRRMSCEPDQCQLMFWNDNFLGVKLAEKLISRGAKKMCIHHANPTMYLQYKVESWRKLGIETVLFSDDLTRSKSITDTFGKVIGQGSVEGIYILNKSNEYIEDLISVLSKIEMSSKSQCHQLRYFLVASTTGFVGENTCLSRAQHNLAATCLDLSSMIKEQGADHHNIVDAIEGALCSGRVMLSARPRKLKSLSLLQQLAALADIRVPENKKADDTLYKFGILEESLPAISSFLNHAYDISLKKDDIPHLTVQKINELEESLSDITQPYTKGLDIFFGSVCTDALLATTEIVVLPTLSVDITLTQSEIDVSKKHLCIVPGMEGHHARFHPICQRLKLPAFVLQPGFDHPTETIRETALRLASILMKKSMIQNNFYLLGHDSGVMVALELAAILEDNGLTGTVFCLGYDPGEFQAELEEQLSDLATEEHLEDAVVRHMVKLIVNGDLEGLDIALQGASTWTEKVDACLRYLKRRTTLAAKYMRAVIESALARIKQVRHYNVAVRQLRSKLVLLRAASTATSPDSSTQSHLAIQKHSQEPIYIHQLSTCLSFITNDSQCASILNSHLDAEILNAFEMQNQCEWYYSARNLSLS